MKKIILSLLLVILIAGPVYAESLTLTTYYPAPFGAYDRLRLVPRDLLGVEKCQAGMLYTQEIMNAPDKLWYCNDDDFGDLDWTSVPGVWTQGTDAGDPVVYLSDSDPDVNVGIGTPSPGAKLEVAGQVKITGGTPAAGEVLTSDGTGLATWELAAGGGAPTGLIAPYGGTAAPSGWLLCDGSAVDRTTYADLFTTIGTIYGAGNGSTTFNVPDLRGRFPLALDNMGGSSANRVTATQADNLGQGSGAENALIAHSHSHSHTVIRKSSWSGGGGGFSVNGEPNTTESTTSDATNAGSGTSSMNPYLTLNYIIKT